MTSTSVVRQINEMRVLRELRERKRATRTELADALGLRTSTLTGISSALLGSGLVREAGGPKAPVGRAGRPAVYLSLEARSRYFAGLEMGSGVSTAVVVDLEGREVARATCPVSTDSDPETVERSLVQLLHEAIGGDEAVAENLAGIGIAVPGVVDGETIAVAPRFGWRDVRFGDLLRHEFSQHVVLENDANAAALSESQFGVGRGRDSLAYILLDRGVGLGLVFDGKLYRGRQGWAGEAGHIQVQDPDAPAGATVKFEDLAGIDNLARAAQPTSDAPTPASTDALAAWEQQITWFLDVLGRLIAPDLIVLGGRASALLDEQHLDQLTAALRQIGPTGEVTTSTFGADAIVMGAASLPVFGFFSVPEVGSARTRSTAGAQLP